MMIFMLEISSHLCFDLRLTLKRKNNIFNVIGVPKLYIFWGYYVECYKFKLASGGHFEFWPPYWILESESKTSISEIDTCIPVKICANFVAFIQKCKIVVVF